MTFFLYDAVVLAAPMAFLVLAVLVLLSRGVSRHGQIWSAFCAVAAVAITFIQLTTRMVASAGVALVTARVAFTAGVFACTLFLAFSLTFLCMESVRRWLLPLAGVFAGSFVVLFWGTDLILAGVVPFPQGAYMAQPGAAFPLYSLFVVCCFFYPVILFIRRYRSSKGRLRLQLGYLLLSGVIIGIASVGSLLITMESRSLLAFIPWLLMVLGPSLVTYAIIRIQLWDIRTVIHKTLLWALASVAVILPVSWLTRTMLRAASVDISRAASIVTLLLFVLFGLHFVVLQPRIDRLFRRRTHDPGRVLKEFNRQILNLRSVGEYTEFLLQTVRDSIYSRDAQMRIIDGSGGRLLEINGEGQVQGGQPLEQIGDVKSWFQGYERPFLVKDGLLEHADGARQDLAEYCQERGIILLMSFVHEGTLLGWLELGEKEDFRAYTREDYDLLEKIRPPATVALANALLFQQLRVLTSTLEERVRVRTQALEEANQRLRDLDRMKSDFFANVSHELRTPLTLIKAPLELYLGRRATELPEDLQRQLGSMHRNTHRLLQMIDHLLDLSKIEAGKMFLRYTELELFAFCELICPPFVVLGEQRGVQVVLRGRTVAPILVDVDRMEIILQNLLANALKFTSKGGAVRLVVDEDETHVCLEVSDTGIGIAPEHLDAIFGRFTQVEGNMTGRFAGAGIGLSLVKKLVELFDGSLSVQSIPERGSIFTVRLPKGTAHVREELRDRRQVEIPILHGRRSTDLQAHSSARYTQGVSPSMSPPPANELAALDAPSVLIVEDNEDLLDFLVQLLGTKYRLLLARDGEEGVAVALRERPALVLSDVMMPRCSGYELTRRIRQDTRIAHIPIILLTAKRGVESQVAGLEAGADDYVGKPFSPDVLLARIKAQFRIRELSLQVEQERKLGMLGTMTAGLAHEVRNPINAVLNGLPLVKEMCKQLPGSGREDAAELLDVAEEGARRILGMVDDLLAFASPGQGELGRWWPKESVEMAIRLLGPRVHGVRILRDIEVDEPVFGHSGQLHQVVMNLLDNALRAVAPGGSIRVRARCRDGALCMIIEDDGVGIPADKLPRIFDPFYTTREVGAGTGLGLHLCRGIVEAHGGRLDARSVEGEGTIIQMRLPLGLRGSDPIREGNF